MRVAVVLAVVAIVAVVGCASTPHRKLRDDREPPAGSTTEAFAARDGTQLLVRYWSPTVAPRGAVVIVHGLKDHSARYAAFADRLADAGYGVYAFDLRGHGRSAGPRVAPASWFDYVDDLEQILGLVEVRERDRPLFVVGHSMGGAIATLAAIRHEPRLSGLVVSAPALVIDASPIVIAVTRMTGLFTPGAPVLALPNEDFSSDPAAAKAMAKDPWIVQSAGPARTARGLVDGIAEIWANLDQLTIPVLALHGTRDKLTAPSGSRALIRAAPSRDKTFRVYEGLAHDLLHEKEGPEIEGDILTWLDAHTGGAAAPSPPIYGRSLAGDPRGWAQALELGAGIATSDAETSFAGGLALNLARGKTLALHGALTARIAGDYRAALLRPLGFALRAGPSVFGLSGGVGAISGGRFALSAGAWIEQPLGPLHLGAIAELSRGFDDRERGPLGSDVLWTALSVRLGRDHRYWPRARAGFGPVITGGLASVADAQAWILTVGLQLYGAD